jgi:hypothetical protein
LTGLVRHLQRPSEVDQDPAGGDQRSDKAHIWPEIVTAVTELFDRAERARVIRSDAAPEDVASILAMLGVVFDMSRNDKPDLWRRYLALMLDGLQATDRPSLPATAHIPLARRRHRRGKAVRMISGLEILTHG